MNRNIYLIGAIRRAGPRLQMPGAGSGGAPEVHGGVWPGLLARGGRPPRQPVGRSTTPLFERFQRSSDGFEPYDFQSIISLRRGHLFDQSLVF